MVKSLLSVQLPKLCV